MEVGSVKVLKGRGDTEPRENTPDKCNRDYIHSNFRESTTNMHEETLTVQAKWDWMQIM